MNECHNNINRLHSQSGLTKWMYDNRNNPEKLLDFLKFRISMLDEELSETKAAISNQNSGEVVDGLVDLCVIAIGTMQAFRVNPEIAWQRVHKANMDKQPGIKPGRPNPLGLPDLIKPAGWQEPTHNDNTGDLTTCLEKKKV